MAEQNNVYPMISEKNWWAIRDKFKASVPAVVSANYVKTLLSLSSDASASSNVIGPLKRLGLIDEENKPTPLANDWRLDNKYGEVCASIVEKVYSRELLDLFPDSVVDKKIARNWFMGNGAGQGAADKMVALFILLKSGEIKERKAVSPKSIAAKNGTKKQVSSAITTAHESVQPNEADKVLADKDTKPSRPNLHIDLQIHISPDSTPEQIDTIFASMAKHFYGADKV